VFLGGVRGAVGAGWPARLLASCVVQDKG